MLTWWTFSRGGYAATLWEPGAVVLVVLLTVLVIARPPSRPPRALVIALGAFAAYTAWSYLSILWANAPGVALEGSHRTLAFLVIFTLMSTARWTPRALVIALVAWLTVATVAGVVEIVQLGGSAALEEVHDARLVEPMGYWNANAALWTMAGVTAMALASRREFPAVGRILLLMAAVLHFDLAVLAQSRGWLFSLPIVAMAALLLVPGRLRLLAAAVPVAVGVAVALPRLLDPFDVGGSKLESEVAGPLLAALNTAADRAWIGLGIAAIVAAVIVLADSAMRPPAWLRGADRRVGLVLAAVGTLALVGGGFAVTRGDPAGRISSAWEDFKSFEGNGQAGQSRFGDLGSSRYDFWRVSLEVAGDAPIAGLGQDNFAEAYLVERDSDEEPRWIHSLLLRLLVHTGMIGVLLFALFAGAVLAAAVWRKRPGPSRVGAGMALLPATVWVAHGSVDWLWEFPALTGAAMAFAGAAASVGGRRGIGSEPMVRRPALQIGAVAAAGVVASVALTTAFLAERHTDTASREWRQDPELALKRLGWASDLNPLSARPPLTRGLILGELGRYREAVASFLEAGDRAPREWLVPFELGLVPDNPDARRELRRAKALNPREELVDVALRRLGTSRPLTSREAAIRFSRRVARRVGP